MLRMLRTRIVASLVGVLSFSHCSTTQDHQITATCTGPGCVFEPGDVNDPVFGFAQSAVSSSTAPCTVADCPSGYNVIQGTAANDTINGTNGSDCILGGDGNDTIDGSGADDYVCGGNGTDTIRGADGNDVLRGEAGNDVLYGETGNDELDGGLGDDNLIGDNGDDLLVGGDGNDTMDGGKGADTIDGGNGNDTIAGGNDSDIIDGGPGADVIDAGSGNDFISGGPGTDTIQPGNGTDTCDAADAVVVGCENGGGGAVCTAPKSTTCSQMRGTAVLINDAFTTGANTAIWPENIGYDGDFNGDWFTDGTSARPHNPRWGWCAQCQIPATTGFVKTINVCPSAGARLSMSAVVDAAQSSSQTRTTLVLYFLNENCGSISVTTSYPRFANAKSTLALYDAAIPTGTTRIIVAPMVYLAADETNSVFYSSLKVTYEPSTAYQTVRSIASDSFSTSESNQYGTNQPAGWGEFGGDWLVYPSANWATLWNETSGGAAPKAVDTGLTKSFTLGAFNAGDVLDVRAFAAANFVDSASLAQLRVIFNDAAQTTVESNRLTRKNWDELMVRRAAIPAGATSAKVVINAYLGAAETASLYVDDLRLTLVRP